MDVTHYIAARQTGKSAKAAALFHEYNGPNTYLVVANSQLRNHFVTHCNIQRNKILLPRPESFCGKPVQTVIVDEYLMIDDKNNFLSSILPAFLPTNSKLILFSTPDKKYTDVEIETMPGLFLKQHEGGYNLNVINTMKDPELHGFRRIYEPAQNLTHRQYFGNQDEFDCEMLGLWKVGQTFSEFAKFYIPKPKKFSFK